MLTETNNENIELEYSAIPKYMKKVLFKWYFWVFWYGTIILLDLVFRFLNTEYKNRSLKFFEVLPQQIIKTIVVIAISYIGIFLFKQFITLKTKVIDNFDLKKKNYPIISRKVFSMKKQIITLFLAILLDLPQIIILYIKGIPPYFPDIPISYIFETWVIITEIPLIFLIMNFLHLIIYMFKTITMIPKELLERKNLLIKPKYDDRSGGFKEVSIFFIKLVGVITASSVFGILYAFYLNIIGQSNRITELIMWGAIFSIIPPASFILLFILPQINYHKLLTSFKTKKINQILENKHNLLNTEILQENSVSINSENIEQMRFMDLIIDDFKFISDWPFTFSGALKIIASTFTPLLSLVLSYLLDKFL
ncbi:MAG: hypothetical protein ACTSP3_02020 [Candidatus Heimdallarchaeaceae archaeon]